jgi:hypothetical protein
VTPSAGQPDAEHGVSSGPASRADSAITPVQVHRSGQQRLAAARGGASPRSASRLVERSQVADQAALTSTTTSDSATRWLKRPERPGSTDARRVDPPAEILRRAVVPEPSAARS